MVLGLAGQTAQQIEKVSLFYEDVVVTLRLRLETILEHDARAALLLVALPLARARVEAGDGRQVVRRAVVGPRVEAGSLRIACQQDGHPSA